MAFSCCHPQAREPHSLHLLRGPPVLGAVQAVGFCNRALRDALRTRKATTDVLTVRLRTTFSVPWSTSLKHACLVVSPLSCADGPMIMRKMHLRLHLPHPLIPSPEIAGKAQARICSFMSASISVLSRVALSWLSCSR